MISSYNDLAATVKVFCVRNDSTFNSQIEVFVSMAEDRIFNGSGSQADPLYSEALRVPELSVDEVLTITDGSATLPARCLGIRRLAIPGSRGNLEYLAPDIFATVGESANGAVSQFYTVEGQSIRFLPVASAEVACLYYQRPLALTNANQTNAILTAYPNVYLAATMAEALLYMQDPASSQWISRLASNIAGFSRTARQSSKGGGSLRVQPRSVIGAI